MNQANFPDEFTSLYRELLSTISSPVTMVIVPPINNRKPLYFANGCSELTIPLIVKTKTDATAMIVHPIINEHGFESQRKVGRRRSAIHISSWRYPAGTGRARTHEDARHVHDREGCSLNKPASHALYLCERRS